MGALGRARRWASPSKEAQRARISSFVGFFSKLINTAAMWPSDTGMRRHWAVMAGEAAGTMAPPSMLPHLSLIHISSYQRIYGDYAY